MYQAKNIILNFNKTIFDLYYKNIYLTTIESELFGKYNIYNLLAAISYAYELGIDINLIKDAIETIKVDGRFMHYTNKDNITAIVDFAHTPNALNNLLTNLIPFKKNRIIHILGATGEKDKTKRKQMGLISTNNSDITIFTSEDPKNENIFQTLLDLTKGIKDKDYYLTVDRKEAITLATNIAKPNDIILITGKGNEQTETIKNYTFNHNDFNIVVKKLKTK